MTQTEPYNKHMMPFLDLFQTTSIHSFKADESQSVSGQADVCVICDQLYVHRIHNTVGHTQMANSFHEFDGIMTTRHDTPLCKLCSQRASAPVHHIESGQVNRQTIPDAATETIAEEASRIVYGDREQAYDDPNQNFRRIAKMWTGTLDKKLAPGCEVTPRDVALMLIQLKISRESFRPKRENRVDIVGYALCLDRIVKGEEDDATE